MPDDDVPRADRPAGLMRRALTALLAGIGMVLATAGLMLATAGPALAHNVLISTDPAADTTLTTAPQTVTLIFDQAVENFEPVLRVFGPGGNDFAAGGATVLGNSVSAPFTAGPAGDYRVAYRIVSADGHPVTGEFTFTLAEAAAGDAVGTPPDQPAADAGDVAVWVWILIGGAVALVVAALVISVVRRPRR